MNESVGLIIGICGGTGSGKTTVANRILETVKAQDVVFIQQDSYYRNLKDLPRDYRGLANFDHPHALDNELLVYHIKKLKTGEPVDLPIYDFKTVCSILTNIEVVILIRAGVLYAEEDTACITPNNFHG